MDEYARKVGYFNRIIWTINSFQLAFPYDLSLNKKDETAAERTDCRSNLRKTEETWQEIGRRLYG